MASVYRDPQLGFVGVGAAPADRWEHAGCTGNLTMVPQGPCPKPPARRRRSPPNNAALPLADACRVLCPAAGRSTMVGSHMGRPTWAMPPTAWAMAWQQRRLHAAHRWRRHQPSTLPAMWCRPACGPTYFGRSMDL